jgi:hypothetical protein
VIHIAGLDVQVTNRLRQRCSWCGALLADYDLERTAVAVEPGHTGPVRGPAMWPIGGLVRVDGPVSTVVQPDAGLRLPEGCCANLDPDATL